jgi:hypothetical protein
MASHRQGPDEWLRQFRRALLIGLPDTWKTSSLLTWERPIAIVNAPGELGSSTLKETNDVHIWTYQKEGKETDYSLTRQLRKDVDEIIGSGKYATLAVEGLRALYDAYFIPYRDEETEAAEKGGRGADYRRCFWLAEQDLFQLIKDINNSGMKYVVMTVWSAPQADDPIQAEMAAKQRGVTVPQHWMPDIPGKNVPARLLGQFGMKANCKPGKQLAPGKWTPGVWTTRNQGTQMGAGLKLPIEIAQRIPTEIEANWMKLEELVMGNGNVGK